MSLADMHFIGLLRESLVGWVPKDHSGNSSTMLPMPTCPLSLFQFFYSLHLGALRSFLKITTCIIVLVSNSAWEKTNEDSRVHEVSCIQGTLWMKYPCLYYGLFAQISTLVIHLRKALVLSAEIRKKKKKRKPEGNLSKPKSIMFSLKPNRFQGQYKCLANLQNLLLSYS